jgi:hypothetical protein
MGQELHRTQILLKQAQHAALMELARRERRSLSDLVRAIVQQELERRASIAGETRRRRLAALERIVLHRDEILERREGRPLEVDVAALIDETREERDDELLGRVLQRRR